MSTDVYEQAVLPLQEEAHETWIDRARDVARRLARQRGAITIDDVRDECPPPEGIDPRVMGSVFKPKKDWICVDYRKSWRRENHGRPVGIWRLREQHEEDANGERAGHA